MTLTLTHIIAEQSPAAAATLLSELLALPDFRGLRQRVIVWGNMPAGLCIPDGVPYERRPRRFSWPPAAGWMLRRAGGRVVGAEIVHAWGAAASSMAGYAFKGTTPLLTTLVDPAEARPWCRWWRDLAMGPEGGNVICTSAVLADRLAAAGVPDRAVTLLPPVMNPSWMESSGEPLCREDLGLPVDARVLLTPGPPSRAGGQFFAVWTTAVLRKVIPNLHLLIPGCSGEQRRLREFVSTMYCPEAFRLCGDRFSFGQLLGLADLLVFPAVADVPVGGLMRAMAAGVPVVAGDVPAVREWITDGQSGFLCRPADMHDLAVRVREALEDDPLRRRCTAEARATVLAADVGRRWVDGYFKLLDDMLALARGNPEREAVMSAPLSERPNPVE